MVCVCVFVVLRLPYVVTQSFAVIVVYCPQTLCPVKLVGQFNRLCTGRGRNGAESAAPQVLTELCLCLI